VGKFADGRMLVHLKGLHHWFTQSRRSPASNFLAARIGALKADVAMRKSRQPPCTAAIFGIATSNNSKLLDVAENFGQAIFSHG
jgi:hypothetical protein